MLRKNRKLPHFCHRAKGFTLIELLIVIAIILLMLMLAIPSFLVLAKNAARLEAYNCFSTLVQLARIESVSSMQYVGLHVQPHVQASMNGQQYAALVTGKQDSGYATDYDLGSGTIEDRAKNWEENEWSGSAVVIMAGRDASDTPVGVVKTNSGCKLDILGTSSSVTVTEDGCPYRINPSFNMYAGFSPQKIAKGYLFGQLDGFLIETAGATNGNYDSTKLDTEAKLEDFLTFTVMFAPTGRLVKYPMQTNIYYNSKSILFSSASKQQIWDYSLTNENRSSGTPAPDGEAGISGVTMVEDEPGGFRSMSGDKRAELLNKTGQYIPINYFTAELLDKR